MQRKTIISLWLLLLVIIALIIINPAWVGSLYRTSGLVFWIDANAPWVIDSAPDMGPLVPDPDTFTVADGYSVLIHANNVGKVTKLLALPNNKLLATVPNRGYVLLLDEHGERNILLSKLNQPYGLELVDKTLYVATADALYSYDFDPISGTAGFEQTLVTSYPAGALHWQRTVSYGPDGRLYIAIGSACDACVEGEDTLAAIISINPDGTDREIFATGLGHIVDLDFHPETQVMYGIDHGHGNSNRGVNATRSELNMIVQGGFYGWPFLQNMNEKSDFAGTVGYDQATIDSALAPVFLFPEQSNPRSVVFLKDGWKDRAQSDALVALNGAAYPPSSADSFAVLALTLETDGTIEARNFITGFTAGAGVIGRPYDIVLADDDSFFVSDGYARVIYHVIPDSLKNRIATEAATSLQEQSQENKQSLEARFAHNRQINSQLTLTAKEQEVGAFIWKQYNCAICHEGAAPILPYNDLQRYSIDDIANILNTPSQSMPKPAINASEQRVMAKWLLVNK